MQSPKPELLWIDIETTGLSAAEDVPLEVGFMLTDLVGRRVDSMEGLIWEETRFYQKAVRRGQRNEIVGAMHERSGLWDDLMETKGKSTRLEFERDAIAWLKSHGVEKGAMPIIGNSIGSLDRPFLLEHFAELNAFLHYRNIDVSTLKELCRRWNAPLFAQHKETLDSKGDASHRVMDDIEASIAEYQTYVLNFLVTDNADR